MSRNPVDSDVVDFVHALRLLVRRVRAAAPPHGLSLTEAAVLGRLERDGPATTAELARAEGMKPQSMGTTIAALETRGLVGRSPHPTDGRQQHIALTPSGATLRKHAKETKQLWLAEAIARLDREDRATLFKAGDIIRRLVES